MRSSVKIAAALAFVAFTASAPTVAPTAAAAVGPAASIDWSAIVWAERRVVRRGLAGPGRSTRSISGRRQAVARRVRRMSPISPRRIAAMLGTDALQVSVDRSGGRRAHAQFVRRDHAGTGPRRQAGSAARGRRR